MKKIFMLSAFLYLLAVSRAGAADPVAEAPKPPAELLSQDKALTDSWESEKKEYERKISELIGKFEESIRAHENALDNGDPARRKTLNEETADLKRSRDHLKRLLAQVSAANVVDLSKMKEELHDRMQDARD